MKINDSEPWGLTWNQTAFGLEPKWTVELDIGAIEQTIQSLRPSSTVQVAFLAQGAFNKLYDVTVDNEVFILRVTLPVDPYYKTMSEVSTLDWISRTTSVPVPRIIDYRASPQDPIGFEWIIISKMPGTPLEEMWRSLSFSTKTSLVDRFAAFAADLFRKQLRGIGNIYKVVSTRDATWSDENPAPSHESTPVEAPDVGRIVSMHFFWGKNISQNVYRGPLSSSYDWMKSRLSLSEKDCQSTLENLPSGQLGRHDAAVADDATRTLEIIQKLQSLLPSIHSPITDGDSPEPSVMVHDDLSSQNILIHDTGELAAVLDWECVSALPLWYACDYPEFLDGPPRSSRADLARYEPDENGELSELYWEHLLDIERTLLRGTFLEKMEELEPGWVDVFNKSQRERDFDFAVQSCDEAFLARHIRAWIDDLTSGVHNPRSLLNRIDED